MTDNLKIVAHRGASGDAPENTLASFLLGWSQGADAVEGDFHLTKDGRIVCIHDRDTGRVAGKSLVVAESTFADLRALDVGAWRKGWGRRCEIPTLAEILATVPDGKMVYLEIKCGLEIIAPMLEEIEASALTSEQVVFISFDAEVIRQVKADAPHCKAYWLVSFTRGDSGDAEPTMEAVLSTLDRIGADGLSSGRTVVTETMARRLLEHGYEFHVWTVDDASDARRFRAWGAGSITTNVPAAVRAGLTN